MKFIFPQNYNFKNKLFGFIEYSTLLFNIIWDLIIFLFLNLIITSWTIKIFIFITLCFPLLLLSFFGFNGENILYVLFYFFKFQFKQKLFFYNKTIN